MEMMTRKEEELVKDAEQMARELAPGEHARVIALMGDLGAGKTTFAKAFAASLGVDEHVTSPTFVIEKRYLLHDQKFSHLIHIDAYRLKDADELKKLDWQRTVSDPKNIILIEWADRVSELIPHDAVRISLAYLDEETRTITYDNK